MTVTSVNDTAFEGDVAYGVVLGAATSAAPDYAGVNPRDVSLTNLDNEVKFYVVNEATSNTTYKYAADGTSQGNTTLGTANTAPRGVASTILGDKTWVVDANRNVYAYSTTSGALLGSWSAGTMASNATPEGIATNGTDVWIVDSRSDKVFRYTGAASQLSGSQTAASSFNLNSGNASPKDIVTDGASLWVVDDTAKTDKVFEYAVAGSLVGSWTIDAANKAPTGITIDPANVSHIWIVDSGTDWVYQYAGAASRTSGSQAAALTFARAAGNTNPQGIADPPAPATATLAGQTSSEASTAVTSVVLSLREREIITPSAMATLPNTAPLPTVSRFSALPQKRGAAELSSEKKPETFWPASTFSHRSRRNDSTGRPDAHRGMSTARAMICNSPTASPMTTPC